MSPHYTGKGDDGTTGLLYGGRVRKDDLAPRAYGAVDEAQAFVGLARAELEPGGEADELLVHVARDLWVVMGELATAPDNLHKLPAGGRVSAEMVERLGRLTEDVEGRFELPREFVIPGQNRTAALLDVARTVVRRAERETVAVAAPDSHVLPYLNRLSSLLWVMARWLEAGHTLPTRSVED